MPQKRKNVSKPKQPKQNKTTRKPTKPTKKMSNKIMSEAKGNDLNEQFQFPSIKREWQKSATHQSRPAWAGFKTAEEERTKIM